MPCLKSRRALPLEEGLHAKLVRFLITLSARRTDARSLARVQHSKLDSRGVGIKSHHASKSVDFTDHVALGKPADCRIARHLADGVGILSEHQGFTAKPRGCHRGLNSGMACPNDDHVIRFRIVELAHLRRRGRISARQEHFHVAQASSLPFFTQYDSAIIAEKVIPAW